MNETPDTESQTPGPAPGEILRRAREAKNLSVGAIATQLNLDLRTVEALESGDRTRLPAVIFVRGYLRSYARMVGVREEDVLVGDYQAPAQPEPRAVGMPVRRRSQFMLPAIPWGGIFSTLLVIAVVALAFQFGPRLVERVMHSGTADAPTTLALPAADGEGVPLSLEPPPAVSPDASGSIQLMLPEPSPVPAEEPPQSDLPEPELPPETEFESRETAVEPSLPPLAQVVPVTAVPAPGQVQMELQFRDDSWVEITGGDRKRLLFGLMRAGDSRTVTGVPPLSVLLGNAQGVDVRVGGKPFALGPHQRGNVARFKVESNS